MVAKDPVVLVPWSRDEGEGVDQETCRVWERREWKLILMRWGLAGFGSVVFSGDGGPDGVVTTYGVVAIKVGASM